MKTVQDLVKLLESGAQPAVQFGNGILDKEGYPEKGMRARVLRLVRTGDDDVVQIVFSFPEFEAHNRPLESFNYYDKSGKPTLNAREAGFYKDEEALYFDRDESLEGTLELLTDERTALYQEFLASGATGLYVSWLEDRVLAAAKEVA